MTAYHNPTRLIAPDQPLPLSVREFISSRLPTQFQFGGPTTRDLEATWNALIAQEPLTLDHFPSDDLEPLDVAHALCMIFGSSTGPAHTYLKLGHPRDFHVPADTKPYAVAINLSRNEPRLLRFKDSSHKEFIHFLGIAPGTAYFIPDISLFDGCAEKEFKEPESPTLFLFFPNLPKPLTPRPSPPPFSHIIDPALDLLCAPKQPDSRVYVALRLGGAASKKDKRAHPLALLPRTISSESTLLFDWIDHNTLPVSSTLPELSEMRWFKVTDSDLPDTFLGLFLDARDDAIRCDPVASATLGVITSDIAEHKIIEWLRGIIPGVQQLGLVEFCRPRDDPREERDVFA